MKKDIFKIIRTRPFSEVRLIKLFPFRLLTKNRHGKAFTLIELLLAVAIIGTLIAVGVPIYSNALNKARINQAISKIALMGQKIDDFLVDNGRLPTNLSEIGEPNPHDPWGYPYHYLAILGKDKQDLEDKWRKDRFLIPLNTDYDLYSIGKDGDTNAPLTANVSHDDIVRANNGGYVGVAYKY
jgi:general secretion pathway protein G